MQVNLLPITHQSALAELGRGATGSARQTFVDLQYSLAFKWCQNLAITLSEMVAYAYRPIRSHSHTVRLGGVIWDVSETGEVASNLVFEKSLHRDCVKSMRKR